MSRRRTPPTLDSVPHRLGRRGYLVDAALALLLLVLSNPDVRPAGGREAAQVVVVYWVFAALSVAGLLIRRRWPLLALGLAATAAAEHAFVRDWHGAQVGFPTLIELAVPITLYTVVSRSPSRRRSALILLVLLAGELAFGLVNPITLGQPNRPRDEVVDVSNGRTDSTLRGILNKVIEARLIDLLALTLAYALGEGTRNRQAYLRTLEQRAAGAEREQHQRIALATANERARIGRDLHDVIAHSLTVIVAQAQAAIAAQQRHPQRATDAMREVISVGRDSLSEMRRLVGAFGPALDNGPTLDNAPPVGVDALPALIERIRAAGLPVRLTLEGATANLPAGVELSAYRIVQEALTNTLKHAGPGAEATVRLALHAEHVAVEVIDDGTGPPADLNARHGNGLRGIAERVNLLGGALTLGPGPEGGFAVRAHLPVAPTGVLP